ncbi:MAG: MAPEG family protein [Bacteroidales bacterium]
MSVKVTAFYALPLALMFVALSMRVIGLRKLVKAAFGDGGDARLGRAIRVHANFAEYVPFALVLIAAAELNGAPWWLLHLLGAVLLAGRLSHAWGVSQPKEDFRFRVAGMLSTFGVLVVAALAAVLA